MDALSLTFAALRNTTARDRLEYARGQARHEALTRFTAAADLLAALGPKSPLGVEERASVLTALIAEHQAAPKVRLWQALLIIAFEPMLRGLRRRLGRQGNEDLDQEVLLGFLEALAALPPAVSLSCPALALRRPTERHAFYAAKRERDRPAQPAPTVDAKPAPPASRDDEPGDELAAEPPAEDPFATRDAVEALVDASAAKAEALRHTAPLTAEMHDVVLATFAGDSSLRAYVDRVHAAEPERTRDATYERLRSARRRFVARARDDAGAHAFTR